MGSEQLNQQAWETVKRYEGLDIAGILVRTPYYVNQVGSLLRTLVGGNPEIMGRYNEGESSYGLYRGKGRPEELEAAVERVALEQDYDLKKANSKALSEIMKLHGLGVDCSGFVFNVLGSELLNPLLDWQDPNVRTVYRAGAFTFAGSASELIKPDQVEPGDLILKKDRNGKYDHVALILQDEVGLVVCQSTRMSEEPGVSVTRLDVNGGQPKFEFRPCFENSWEDQFSEGGLEFRRLKLPLRV